MLNPSLSAIPSKSNLALNGEFLLALMEIQTTRKYKQEPIKWILNEDIWAMLRNTPVWE